MENLVIQALEQLSNDYLSKNYKEIAQKGRKAFNPNDKPIQVAIAKADNGDVVSFNSINNCEFYVVFTVVNGEINAVMNHLFDEMLAVKPYEMYYILQVLSEQGLQIEVKFKKDN